MVAIDASAGMQTLLHLAETRFGAESYLFRPVEESKPLGRSCWRCCSANELTVPLDRSVDVSSADPSSTGIPAPGSLSIS
jgi:hypothetical protein